MAALTAEPGSSPIDVLLVGFGAVGIMYAYKLSLHENVRVSVVARSNYDLVTAKGVHLKSEKHGTYENWKPYRCFKSVQEALDRPYAYILLTTKALPSITPNSKILAPVLQEPYASSYPQPTFVVMQNGLWIETDLYEAASSKAPAGSKPKIISNAVYINANVVGDGRTVEHSALLDTFVIGIYRHNDNSTLANSREEAEDLSKFAALLGDTTQITIVPEIQREKYTKNLWNAAFATAATLTRTGLNSFFIDRSTSKIITSSVRATMLEIIVVGHALGFDPSILPDSLADETIKRSLRVHDPNGVPNPHKPSMLVDLENGRPLELDVTLGSVVKKAHELGVPIPRLETVYALLSVVQNELIRNAAAAKK